MKLLPNFFVWVSCSSVLGNVLNETFRMECSGWMDEGFEDDVNSTDNTRLLLSPLIYKFLLRKNDTIVPISEGGRSVRETGAYCCRLLLSMHSRSNKSAQVLTLSRVSEASVEWDQSAFSVLWWALSPDSHLYPTKRTFFRRCQRQEHPF